MISSDAPATDRVIPRPLGSISSTIRYSVVLDSQENSIMRRSTSTASQCQARAARTASTNIPTVIPNLGKDKSHETPQSTPDPEELRSFRKRGDTISLLDSSLPAVLDGGTHRADPGVMLGAGEKQHVSVAIHRRMPTAKKR